MFHGIAPHRIACIGSPLRAATEVTPLYCYILHMLVGRLTGFLIFLYLRLFLRIMTSWHEGCLTPLPHILSILPFMMYTLNSFTFYDEHYEHHTIELIFNITL